MGDAHVVTEASDNVILGLDGRRALDVFNDDVDDESADGLERIAGDIHAAFPVAGSDTGDYTVRSLIGIDPERGWLAIGAPVQTGDRILFVRRDAGNATADMVVRLGRLADRLSAPPRGGIYFSCVARGPSMFGREGHEVALVRRALGDFPMVGFYGGGEISNNRLYGYTGVLALFV
jgi:small ligand-binding sensory domain FIST